MPSGVYERKPKAKRAYKRRAPPSPTTAAIVHLERAAMLMPRRIADLTECHLEVLFALKTLQGAIQT